MLLTIVAAALQALGSSVKLTSGATSLDLDQERCEIVSLESGGINFVAERGPLAALYLSEWDENARATGRTSNFSTSNFTNVECVLDGPGIQATFSLPDVGGVFSNLTVEARCSATSAEAPVHLADVFLCRVNVTGVPMGWAVAAASFPANFEQPPSFTGTPADTLLFPAGGGIAVPVGNTSVVGKVLYPGKASTQLAARVVPGGRGLYLAAYDVAGNVKEFSFKVSHGAASLGLLLRFPEIAGASVVLDYDVALGTFGNGGRPGAGPLSWRDAADKYKSFASGAPWCAQRLPDRDDVPLFLTSGSGVFITSIDSETGFNPSSLGPHLEKLAGKSAAYKNLTGLKHIVSVPYGWEHLGTWAGINYFPAQPSNQDWLSTSAQLRASDDFTSFLISGYYWVIKRQATGGGPAFDNTTQMQAHLDMLVKNPDGSVFEIDAYDDPTGPQSWRGLSVKLCHGSPDAEDTMVSLFEEAIEGLGGSLISFDQEIGGGQDVPCYDPTHGHPPGYGKWMYESFARACERIRNDINGTQFALMTEQPSELTIQLMGSYWSRQFAPFDYPWPTTRSVGLFSYLYHEYVTAIAAALSQGQGGMGTRPDYTVRAYAMARGLVKGLLPGPFASQVPLNPTDSWTQNTTAAMASYARAFAAFPEFLSVGRTLHPVSVVAGNGPIHTWIYNKIKQRVNVTVEAGLAGSFANPKGDHGTVFASVVNRPVNATLDLQGAGIVSGNETLVYDPRTGAVVQRFQGVPSSVDLACTQPYATRMVVVRGAGVEYRI